MKNNFSYFQNTQCEYFPCHKTSVENFNCLFCFCPLYHLPCGGNPRILESGVKDCSSCLLPHKDYDYILEKLKKLENSK